MDGTLFMYVAGDSESGPRKFLFERFWQVLEAVDIFDQSAEHLCSAWFFSGGEDLISGMRCFLEESQFIQSFFYLAGEVLMFSDEEMRQLNEFLTDWSLSIEDMLFSGGNKNTREHLFARELWNNITRNDYKLMGDFVHWFSFVFSLFEQEEYSPFQDLLDFFEEYQEKIFANLKASMNKRGISQEVCDEVCREISDFFKRCEEEEKMDSDQKLLKFGNLQFVYTLEEEKAANLFFDDFLNSLEDEGCFEEISQKIREIVADKADIDWRKFFKNYFLDPDNFFEISSYIRDEAALACEEHNKKDIRKSFNDLHRELSDLQNSGIWEKVTSPAPVEFFSDKEYSIVADQFFYSYTDTTYYEELVPVKAFLWIILEKADEILSAWERFLEEAV